MNDFVCTRVAAGEFSEQPKSGSDHREEISEIVRDATGEPT
ncbi:hypothetical protein [Afipia sp. P52-10]|nr:hypothetical protein [Afipia sp. P52-10]